MLGAKGHQSSKQRSNRAGEFWSRAVKACLIRAQKLRQKEEKVAM